MRSSILGLALLCVGALCASAGEVAPHDIAFAEGVWAFSQGDAPEAIVHFREALGFKPGDGFARYLLGLSLLRTGEAEEAAKEIAASLEADPPPPVDRNRILADLQAAQLAAAGQALAAEDLPGLPEISRVAGKKAHRWSGSAFLAAERDSNPNLLSDDLALPVVPGGQVVSGRTSDIAALAEIQASHRPIRLPGGWDLGIDLLAGGSVYRELDYLDLARAGGTLQLSKGLGPAWTLLLRTGAEEVFLDGSDYLRTAGAGASLLFSPTASDTTQLDLQFRDRSFADHPLADPRRSGGEPAIALRQTRYLGRRDRYVALGIATADRQAQPEFQRARLGGSIDAAFPLGPTLSISISGWLDEESYDDSASNLLDPQGPPRDDRIWSVSSILAVSITDRLQARLRGSYTRRSSNVDLGQGFNLDYRRTVVGAGLTWRF